VVQKALLFESESAASAANYTKTLQKNKQVQIGTILRSGTEIFPGITSSNGGLILNKNFTQFTLRLGIPFLSSARGIIHVFQNDLIQKNDLLVTLKSRRLQTEDIVQGIPKIEQLFEARETQGGTIIRNSVHTRLKKYFLSSLKSKKVVDNALHTHLSKAVTDSFNKIQFFLVQSILQAYSSQGVKLSQKHIEIIVRQMTTRVRILAGGDSGLLPGEVIQFTKIQKLNDQLCSLGKRPAIYEPLILGITKSVFQSESFLLSASFQEVSRVLVRSALTKKTDFLRGLHENVILGQLVPTGTGLVSTNTKILKK
jgi:DNA-directed RNA polymerase subunit beta'